MWSIHVNYCLISVTFLQTCLLLFFLELAGDEKLRLEEKQRAVRRQMQADNETWDTRYETYLLVYLTIVIWKSQ